MTENSVEQSILEATINCIEKYGVDKVTTRKIAKEAGTNIASINYYFRSKDDLIAKALDTTLRHMMEDLIVILEQEDKTFEEVFHDSIVWILEGSERFPRLITSHIYEPIMERKPDTRVALAFRNLVDIMLTRAKHSYPSIEVESIRNCLVDILSILLFSVLAPEFFITNDNRSYHELAQRYVRLFKKMILN
jgi:AcrR family transcriptional regulator